MDAHYTTDDQQVIARESKLIDKQPSERRTGLAFSGGGIRSASFGMGVMQALVGGERLEQFDYLSTVSGGGYLGCSLTWFLSQRSNGIAQFGTRSNNFPFGRSRQGGKRSTSNAILDFIRQHGNYLIPGRGLNPISLVAVTLRTMLISFAIYFALATTAWSILFEILDNRWLHIETGLSSLCTGILLFLGAAWLMVSAAYSLFTFISGARYTAAVRVQQILGALIAAMIAVLVILILPILHEHLPDLITAVVAMQMERAQIQVSAGAGISAFSVIVGSAFALVTHLRQMRAEREGIVRWQIVCAAILLLFGVLYGAYIAGLYLQQNAPHLVAWVIILSLAFGLICNVNYFGLNRMYRDRLMETFMPDLANTKSGMWDLATAANDAKLQDMCQRPNARPYHLINCNIVLVDSHIARYRGRRGDSFIASPLYCGSDATGWRKTEQYMHSGFRNGLTLPTAMAISGAAANPGAGVAGRGITTNRLVSAVMSLLNLRLGFWASNPRSDRSWTQPNYLYPGFKGGLSITSGLRESARAIELTDGGHFENLAIYELVRRRLDLIVVVDAGADRNYDFSDLANAVERVRVDFGAHIVFEDDYPLELIRPDSNASQSPQRTGDYPVVRHCFAIARIEYSQTDDEHAALKRRIGHLVYIKPALIAGLSPDVLVYRRQHESFPHQSTADQFFDEQQFEAYRELGYYLGWSVLQNRRVRELFDAETVELMDVT